MLSEQGSRIAMQSLSMLSKHNKGCLNTGKNNDILFTECRAYLFTNIDVETFRQSERYEVAFGNDDSICSKGNMGSMVHADLVM